MSASQKPQSQTEKVLDFIELTGAAFEKMSAELATKEAQDQKIAKLIPNVVQSLLDNGRIEPHEKEAAEAALRDPVRTLEILGNTAKHRSNAEQASIGQPMGKEKRASYNSLSDNYVGRRSRPQESESDRALKRGLGLA